MSPSRKKEHGGPSGAVAWALAALRLTHMVQGERPSARTRISIVVPTASSDPAISSMLRRRGARYTAGADELRPPTATVTETTPKPGGAATRRDTDVEVSLLIVFVMLRNAAGAGGATRARVPESPKQSAALVEFSKVELGAAGVVVTTGVGNADGVWLEVTSPAVGDLDAVGDGDIVRDDDDDAVRVGVSVLVRVAERVAVGVTEPVGDGVVVGVSVADGDASNDGDDEEVD